MNPDLLNIITSQAARAGIGTVGLVGSNARGESQPWHDVDIFVTVPLERAAAFGAALAAAFMALPLMVRPIRLAIEGVDRGLEQAAATLGLLLLLVASVMLIAARTYNPFIYFRF